jgi:hypothetical protein
VTYRPGRHRAYEYCPIYGLLQVLFTHLLTHLKATETVRRRAALVEPHDKEAQQLVRKAKHSVSDIAVDQLDSYTQCHS